MADVSVHTHVFTRGSTVLDYWLAHAEGLTVQPLGARVEEVVLAPPVGRAQALRVRSRSGRLRTIPAEAIAAVEPSAGRLLLDGPRRGRPVRSAASGTGTAAHAGWTATVAGARWVYPHAIQILRTVATDIAVGFVQLVRWTAAALSWLAPRIVGLSRAATERGRAASERGRTAIAAQRAQRARQRL